MKQIKLFWTVAFAIFGLQTNAYEYDSYDIRFLEKEPIGEYMGHPLYSLSENESITMYYGGNFNPVEINGRTVRPYEWGYTTKFIYKFTLKDIPSTNIYTEVKLYRGYYETEYCCYVNIPTPNNLNRPSHQPIVLAISATSVTRWERSNDGGITWENIECVEYAYLEQDPEEGTVMYRILQTDGTYSEILTINYYDVVPSEIVASPATISKTVDESVSFTLDVVDDGYSYQWYHNGSAISGATLSSYSIPTVKMSDAGTYYCEVSNEVSSVNSTETNLTVYKCAQAINFPEIETRTYGDADFTLPATTDKGLSIVYQSTNSSVATVNGNTVHITGVGETNIIASQAGSNDYLEAATVTRKLVVNKIPQAITFEELPTKTYEDKPFTLPAVSDKGLVITYTSTNPEVATVSENTVTILNAGTTEIVANQAGDAHYYAAASIARILTVNRCAQSIDFPAIAPKYYGDAPVELAQYSSKNLEITYSSDCDVCTVDGNKLVINKPGTAVITANQSGNKNYLPANPVSQTLVVGKAMQTIVWSEIPGKYYGDSDFALPKTTDKGLTISYVSDNEAVATVNENIVHITGTGRANITASQAGDDFYHEAASVTLTLTVSKSYQNITFNELPTCTYGDPAIELGAYTNSSSSVRYESSDTEVATISGSTLTIVGAGSCYITAYAGSDDNFYEGTPVQRQLVVNKADQTIEFPAIADKVYGDVPFELSAVSNRQLPITYSSSLPSRISISGSTATIKGAGSVMITATQEGTRNYNGATAQIQVNVNKAMLTASADNVTREYGELNPDLTISYAGFKNGDTQHDLVDLPVATCSATRYSNVGAYDITIAEITDNNYSLIYQKGSLIVTKAPLTVIANDVAKIYGEKNPTLTVSYSGFKNNQTESELLNKPTVSTTAKAMSDVGEYPITVEGGNARNYEIVYREGILTINKATLAIALDNAEREYGAYAEYVLTYTGFKGNDTKDVLDILPSVVTDADIETPAGKYAIMLEGGNDNNYIYSFRYQDSPYITNSILTITKAPLTIVADDKYKGYLEQMPDLTMTYIGLRNGDTADDLDQWPYINCNATASSSRGQYDIILSGGYDNNYDYILQDGTLTIGNSSSTMIYANSISLEPNYITIIPGDIETLTATILPSNTTNKNVIWKSSDQYVATVNNGVVTALNIGQTTISATTTDGSNLTAYCIINVTLSGIEEVEIEAIFVWSVNGQILVKNAPIGSYINIYSTSGAMVASQQVSNETTSFDMIANGMYIVNINGQNYKVLVR